MPTLQSLLLDCIHRDRNRLSPAALQSLHVSDWNTLASLSLTHRVFAQVHARLSRPDFAPWVPMAILDRLKQAKLSNALRNLRIRNQLGELLTAFGKAGLPVMVLKGAYLAEHIDTSHSQRVISDIDLLTPPDLLPVVQALLPPSSVDIAGPEASEIKPAARSRLMRSIELIFPQGCRQPA